MCRIAATDALQLRAVCEDLGTLRAEGRSVFDSVLPELRRVIGVEVLLVYRMREKEHGFEVDLLHWSMPHSWSMVPYFAAAVALSPSRIGNYDPLRPEPEQRNRVIDPMRGLSREEVEMLPMFRGAAIPMGFGNYQQLRALVCEGSSLLAWFGVLHPEPLHQREFGLLTAVMPAIRQRLSIERRLRDAPRKFAALDAALELLGAPAFILGRKGEICEANSAAKIEIKRNGTTMRSTLRDAVARRPSTLRVELTPLADRGFEGYIAVVREMGEEARISERVHIAATRWGLSARQREVLDLVVRGAANAVIAQSLRIAERTVEFHVTALFDRVGVETRAALTAAVLASR